MTLGPDDLPDPWGEGGVAQVICGCTSEQFLFIHTGTTIRAICATCRAVNGEWTASETTPSPPPLRQFPAVHAEFIIEATQPAPPPELPEAAILPRFPPAVANTYLRGGPANGNTIWLPPECTEFWYGTIRYQPTDDTQDGRNVWQVTGG